MRKITLIIKIETLTGAIYEDEHTTIDETTYLKIIKLLPKDDPV